MNDHLWQTAKDDFDCNILPVLQRDGLTIGAKARAGDEQAKRVVDLYTMLHRSFDPMTLTLLKDALKGLTP